MVLWAPRKYGTRSFFHRYCCEAFPHGRIYRCAALSITLCFNSFLWAAEISTMVYYDDSPAFVAVLPIIVFAFKRISFVLQVPNTQDDSCFKNYTCLAYCLGLIMQLNVGVAGAACAARDFTETITFIVVDWANFALRTVLLLRVGQSAFPGLLRFLLAKQLENVPRPMYNPAASMGDAIAMRQMQAYFCILENITLTTDFIYMFIFCVSVVYIAPDELLIFANIPSRNLGIPAIYLVSDFIQDFAGNKTSDKFSNWSTIYKGFFKKLAFLPFMVLMTFLLGYFVLIGQTNQKARTFATRGTFSYYGMWHFPTSSVIALYPTQQ